MEQKDYLLREIEKEIITSDDDPWWNERYLFATWVFK